MPTALCLVFESVLALRPLFITPLLSEFLLPWMELTRHHVAGTDVTQPSLPPSLLPGGFDEGVKLAPSNYMIGAEVLS